MTGNLVIDNAKEIRLSEADGDGANYTGLKAQAQSADIVLTLPAVAPTTGQVLKSSSTATTLEWATDSATDSSKLPLTGGTLTGNLTLNAQSDVRFADADSSHYIALQSPGTIASSFTLTLPATDAAVSGYVLASDASGTLSWVDPGSSSSPTFTGDATLTNDGALIGFSNLSATYTGNSKTLTVTVASKTGAHRYNGTGSSSGYKIGGKEAPFLTLTPGRTYVFDQADNSNSGHPLRFYLEADKTTAYTTGVTTNGTAGSAGAYTQIVVSDTTPQILHYMCSSHASMGNSVQTNSNIASTAKTLATARTIGGVSFDGSANINLAGVNAAGNQDTSGTAAVATAITIADESSDTTCFPLFATAATGNLGAKSGSNLTFNSSSGALTATSFVGALTGNVTGNASGSAATVTGAAQSAITSLGTLTSLGISGNLTVDTNTLHVDATNNRVGIGNASPNSLLNIHGVFETNAFDNANGQGGRVTTGGLLIGDAYTAGKTTSDDRNAIIWNERGLAIAFGTNNAERMQIDSSGKLLVNRNAAYGSGKAQIFNTSQYLLDLSAWSADANGPTVDFYKSRNGTIGSSTVVQDNDVVGKLRFLGNDGANSRTAAQITAQVDGTPGTNDMPGRLVFSTTADGASSPTERMQVTSGGDCIIGATSGSHRLTVQGSGTEIARFLGANGADLKFRNSTSNDFLMYTGTSDRLLLGTNGQNVALTLDVSQNATFAGTVSDSKGDLRNIPMNYKTGAYTLLASDAGKHIMSNSSVTIPASVMAEGNAVTIVNMHTGDMTITQASGLTMYNTADASTGNRVLATRGMATILFTSSTTAYMSGAGLS